MRRPVKPAPESLPNGLYGTALQSGYCQIKDDNPRQLESEIDL
jgi:hypothetical protein